MPEPAARFRRLRGTFIALLTLALYALLIDAGIETYQSASPVAIWVAVPVALYVSFTLWLVRQQRARTAARTSIWMSAFLFLAMLAVTATMPAGLDQGVRVAGYDTSTVLSATTIAVIALALVALTLGSPLPMPARIFALLAACYGLAAFGTGIAWRRSYVQLLQGHSLWERAPYWLQGAFIGALIVVPLAFIIEVGVALARVQLRGRRHRIVFFALAIVIAYSALTATPPSPSAPPKVPAARVP